MNWAHLGTVIVAAFLASLVECVEALTIVMAVGTTRGWRPALTGAGAGAFVLTWVTLVAGPALQRIPLTSLQLVIGVLLLIFGMRWLVKAILRASGVIGLHDEAAIYAQEKAVLARDRGGDRLALLTAFKAVILEGVEVIFVVIAVGGGAHGLLAPAAVGAVLAVALVTLAGFAVRRPLARVPENALKFAVAFCFPRWRLLDRRRIGVLMARARPVAPWPARRRRRIRAARRRGHPAAGGDASDFGMCCNRHRVHSSCCSRPGPHDLSTRVRSRAVRRRLVVVARSNEAVGFLRPDQVDSARQERIMVP